MIGCKVINFKDLGDHRGSLIAVEENKDIPFKIKRVYYIVNTPENIDRGFHAHKNLKQIAIALKGSCIFKLDNGTTVEEIILDDPKKGLLIDSIIWREMKKFSKDCVLLVLANEHYDESDYIRDYNDFINEVKKL